MKLKEIATGETLESLSFHVIVGAAVAIVSEPLSWLIGGLQAMLLVLLLGGLYSLVLCTLNRSKTPAIYFGGGFLGANLVSLFFF